MFSVVMYATFNIIYPILDLCGITCMTMTMTMTMK